MANSLQFQISDMTGVIEDKVVNQTQLLNMANAIRKQLNYSSLDESNYPEVTTVTLAYNMLALDNYSVVSI